ncbi:molybdenum cofactor cytidylyltransferase/nicotine blue oxidoreductase [Rubrivivax gelatinosus]|uniref:Molybdenum cofactor cytidylyltransferase/nicotine blue oxidoreductase n=1 Tax=Rubrivivax gelatinosus TaxID=28068 RepID=A0A4R2MBF5_RUBGE|nr:NTP transferase domain-containing protein [Rubrivivax gelatinosus]TCP04052.1 molybdenum cofactor cytidylyltransferase/nicotine blue oxidoreductase [Rubrivivax gelatinosus]
MPETPVDPAPLCAVVLAAGQGRRLGGCAKAALEIDGRSLFDGVVQALRGAGAAEVLVVVGPYLDTWHTLASRVGALVLEHRQKDASRAESQRLGLRAGLERRPGHDLMFCVADLPLLHAGAVRALVAAWHRREHHVQALVPWVGGQRGHPVLLSAAAAARLDAAAAGVGLRDWLAANPQAVQALACEDECHVVDLDTEQDLETLRRRLAPARVDWPAGTRPQLSEGRR